MARAPLKDVTLNTLIADNVSKIAASVKEPDVKEIQEEVKAPSGDPDTEEATGEEIKSPSDDEAEEAEEADEADEAAKAAAEEGADGPPKTPQVSVEPEAVWLKACGSYPITDSTDFNARYPVGLAVRVYRVTEFMKCQIAAKLVVVVPAPE